jgi:hypothetical protein
MSGTQARREGIPQAIHPPPCFACSAQIFDDVTLISPYSQPIRYQFLSIRLLM